MYKVRAWLVHLYTSLGLIVALLAVNAVAQGNAQAAFIFLGMALFIDATDGTLARSCQVLVWAPSFDGRKLDDIIDYMTYAFIPIFLALRFGLLQWNAFGMVTASLVLISAVYGFCQKAAKTTEGYFTGFPNYWNIVVFYFFLMQSPPLVNGIVLLALAALVFVPVEYLSYSSRPLRRTTILMSGLYGLALLYLLVNFNTISLPAILISLVFPAYYVIVSLVVFMQRRSRVRREVPWVEET
jgi:phosphatidylcholine synthase